jgi:hypothetical protein
MKSIRFFPAFLALSFVIVGCEQPKVEVKQDSDLSKVIGGDFQKQTSGNSSKVGNMKK